MAIATYNWAVQVLLIKLVHRTDGVAARYAQTPKQVDITSWLGDQGAIRTNKSLDQPAGAFSIVVSDIEEPDISDTLYALIEAMDVIEIRASRWPHLYVGQKLPLIMRGFVTSVRRVEEMSADGQPNRTVVVEGQDMGKWWHVQLIFFQIAYFTDIPYLNSMLLTSVTGIERSELSYADFLTQLTERVVNKKLEQLDAYTDQAVPEFTVQAAPGIEGNVEPWAAGSFEGSCWDLAVSFADRPWNELWIQESEAGPIVTWRPVPYQDINGNFIMPGAVDPGTINTDIVEVVRADVMHSDLRLANFYWVDPGASSLNSAMLLSVASIQKGIGMDFTVNSGGGAPTVTGTYKNDAPELYGIRQMRATTHLFPGAMPSTVPNGAPQDASGALLNQWFATRMNQLKMLNRDNGVFEEGYFQVMGREDYVPGKYLQLQRGLLTSRYYITQVDHTFQPLTQWTTNLVVQRGTGFLQRNKAEGSPYWAEGRQGPYD